MAKKANCRHLMYMTQFQLLDYYKRKMSVDTPFARHRIETLTRISEYEYQVFLRPMVSDLIYTFYLKLNYEKSGNLNVLFRFDSKEHLEARDHDARQSEHQDKESPEGGDCSGR